MWVYFTFIPGRYAPSEKKKKLSLATTTLQEYLSNALKNFLKHSEMELKPSSTVRKKKSNLPHPAEQVKLQDIYHLKTVLLRCSIFPVNSNSSDIINYQMEWIFYSTLRFITSSFKHDGSLHLHIVNRRKWLWKPVKFFVIGFCSLFWGLTVHKTWQNTIGGYECLCN